MASLLPFFRTFRGSAKLAALKNAITVMYQTKPQVANAFVGFVTFGVGDIVAQRLDKSKSLNQNESKLDLVRSAQIGLLGLCMNGVALHYWYGLLDRFLGTSMKSTYSLILKVVADQVFYAPFAIVSFFAFNAARTSSSLEEFQSTLRSRVDSSLTKTYIADCNVWPLANLVNFRYIPLSVRPTFTASVQLLWQTYMSAVVCRPVSLQPTGDFSINSAEIQQRIEEPTADMVATSIVAADPVSSIASATTATSWAALEMVKGLIFAAPKEQ